MSNNAAINPTQNNTKAGAITAKAATDLTGKEGFIAVLGDDGSGNPTAALPASVDAHALYIIETGGPSGSDVSLQPITNGEQFRLKLKGAVAVGEELSLADPGTAADAGKVRKRPTTSGTWRTIAIAEEKATDGGFVATRQTARVVVVS